MSCRRGATRPPIRTIRLTLSARTSRMMLRTTCGECSGCQQTGPQGPTRPTPSRIPVSDCETYLYTIIAPHRRSAPSNESFDSIENTTRSPKLIDSLHLQGYYWSPADYNSADCVILTRLDTQQGRSSKYLQWVRISAAES